MPLGSDVKSQVCVPCHISDQERSRLSLEGRGRWEGSLAFLGRGPPSDLVFLGLKLNLCFRSFKIDEPCHSDGDASWSWSCAPPIDGRRDYVTKEYDSKSVLE